MKKVQNYLALKRAHPVPAPLMHSRVLYTMSDLVQIIKHGSLKSTVDEVIRKKYEYIRGPSLANSKRLSRS
jgi:hypothetical protein